MVVFAQELDNFGIWMDWRSWNHKKWDEIDELCFSKNIYYINIMYIYVYTYIYGANPPEMGWICDFVVFRKLFLVDLADSSDSLGSFFWVCLNMWYQWWAMVNILGHNQYEHMVAMVLTKYLNIMKLEYQIPMV
jgi:hypothetical protein